VTSGKLQDKTILIVGGTSGLGWSAARACLAEGAAVVVTGRDETKCRAAEAAAGQQLRAIVADATLADSLEPAIRCAHDMFGGLDGLYHVAGGSGRSHGDGPLDSVSDEGWIYTLHWNLDSVFYSNRAALRYWLLHNRAGVILNLTSVLGFAPSPRYFATHAYAAAKAAVIGMTRAAAAYYARYNVRINALAPALVETPMSQRALGDEEILRFIATKQPLDGGRIGRPEDADDAVVYLLSDASRFVTGQVLAIDGGWCLSDGQAMVSDDH
jgi:NAD(P)-dependent dehydrogenase (short-subunit alcohol dehydrogenase family)